MVKDIVPGTSSSTPKNFATVGNTLFFQATDGTGAGGHGIELWKSDGTAAGTVLVKDINTTASGSGTASSNPANLTNFNGTLFFTATDGTVAGTGHGGELWKSDGTSSGTQLVADINPGTGSSSPANLTVAGSTLYFSATDGTHGVELWKTDGSAGGTSMVLDIFAGSAGSSPNNLYYYNGLLYFRATISSTPGATGAEPYVSDGTSGGTVILQDINPGTASSLPLGFTGYNGFVYFGASDGTGTGGHGTELWRTDGTSAGTTLFDDLIPGTLSGNPGPFIVYNGKLIFDANDASGGNELFISDGTLANTGLLKDINPGSASSAPVSFVISNNLLFFGATQASTGAELWTTDGTPSGTVMTKDINPGASSGVAGTGFSSTDFNGTLYFAASDGTTGNELWKSDGTAAGTTLVQDLEPGIGGSFPGPLGVANGTLLLQAEPSSTGLELFRLNNAPTAVNDSYSTNENTPLTVSAPGLLANDTDPDGNLNTLTAAKVTNPGHGAVTVNSDGSFTYTPAANYHGPDSFTYKANDGSLDSNVATVNLTVNFVNQAPVANNDSYTTNQNTSLTVAAPGVLANDTDVENDPLTAKSPSVPAHGAVALNPNGGFNYIPNAGYAGADSFTYKANDGSLDSNLATVNIAVTAPAVSASPSTVPAGSPVTATWSGIGTPTATDWVGLYANSTDPNTAVLAWAYTGGAPAGNLNLVVPNGATPAATYELRLFANNTYTRLATSAPFTVTASATTVAASPASVTVGTPVTATWAGIASPSATDWVGLYPNSSAPNAGVTTWAYTGGGAGGNLNLVVPNGATPGATYELRLFSNNTYTRLATSAPFTVTASAAAISASPASVNAGSAVVATWSGIPAPTATDWVGLYANSTDPNPAIVAWTYTNGAAAGNLNLTVPPATPSGSTYELRLFSANSYTRLATSGSFTVVATSPPTVSSTQSSVANGNPLTANWSAIPSPSATDWIGIYANSTDPNTAIVAWAYTGGGAAGSLNLVVPLGSPPGATYELRLFANNTYTRLATSAPFTVT